MESWKKKAFHLPVELRSNPQLRPRAVGGDPNNQIVETSGQNEFRPLSIRASEIA